MKESPNSKIHVSINFLLSICLLIQLYTLLLGPSLHCNTSLHFTTLHPTTLHYNIPVPTDWCRPGLLGESTDFKRQSQELSTPMCLKHPLCSTFNKHMGVKFAISTTQNPTFPSLCQGFSWTQLPRAVDRPNRFEYVLFKVLILNFFGMLRPFGCSKVTISTTYHSRRRNFELSPPRVPDRTPLDFICAVTFSVQWNGSKISPSLTESPEELSV
jgi:hypothetical protein